MILRPRSHDAGTKLCRHNTNTVCNCSHDASSTFVLRGFFPYLNFTLITVGNIIYSQNVSSNCNETLMVTYSHSAETVEFRYHSGFKLSRLELRFYIFCAGIVCTQPLNVRISFRFQTLPESCEPSLNQSIRRMDRY